MYSSKQEKLLERGVMVLPTLFEVCMRDIAGTSVTAPFSVRCCTFICVGLNPEELGTRSWSQRFFQAM